MVDPTVHTVNLSPTHNAAALQASSRSRISIFSFPVELAQDILSYCHPWDVATFSQTSRAAYALVYHPFDQYLWRQLFAAYPFDPPHFVTDLFTRKEKLNWKKELTTRMKVEKALFCGPMSVSDQQLVIRTLVTVMEDSSWAISESASARNTSWLKRIIRDSHLLHNIYSVPESEDEQDYARLRAYLALAIMDDKHNMPAHSKLLDKRDNSRAHVYNLLNYTAENNWGPFLPDGCVDWVHTEHLVNVVALNIRELPGNWANTRPPTLVEGPRSSTCKLSRRSDDWAEVEGTWRRYVSFMDYRDLFAFNYQELPDGPRHPKFFKDPRFREATRLIELKLTIIPAQALRFHKVAENPSHCHIYKPICFSGSSRGVNGNEAAIEGCVTMGIDGTPRWQLISIYDHHPQWSSNGVQLGGLRSAMGIIGTWTTTNHDQDDPAGPFWLWKVDEDTPPHQVQVMEFT